MNAIIVESQGGSEGTERVKRQGLRAHGGGFGERTWFWRELPGIMPGSVIPNEVVLGAGDQERKREPRKPPFKFLVPLIYAPVLPLIRIGLRKQPVLRDRVFTAVLGAALLHGGYLVTDLYDVESK